MESDPSDVEEAENAPLPPRHVLQPSPLQRKVSHGPEFNTSPAASPISQRIVPAIVLDNPYAQGEDGETYFGRENRYFGPASTWLSWTEQERTTALSLDRLRSQDLSIHLINAYGLKRKAQTLRGREPKRSKKGKERATSASSFAREDDDSQHRGQSEDGRFRLAKSWTAWPMPPDQVPREQLLPQMFDDGTRCTNVDLRPSASLEEWLIATATKVARERWNAREWESQGKPMPASKRDMKAGHGDGPETTTMSEEEQFAEDEQGQDFEEAEQGTSPSVQSGNEPVFYSQPAAFYDEASSSENESSDSDATEPDRRPVPLADDEKARQCFLPSVRHILSKLDDLLLGLHKARYAYAAKPPGRARGKSSQSHSQTPEKGQSRGRSTHSRSKSRSRRRARSSSAYSDVSNTSNLSATSSRRSRRVEKLQLRDWSDVLGMASLTGWDPAIVERASERCAKLFGENMLFRTFHEGEGRQEAESHFTDHLADETDGSTPSDEEEGASQAEEDDILVVRVSKPCSACQAAKSHCQPANQELGVSKPCRACIDDGTNCSGIRVSSSDARVCPHRSCPRHTIPFHKPYHLQRHLDAMHAPTARSMSRSRTASAVPMSSEAYTSDDISMISSTPFSPASSGKHDILCPLPSCPRSRQPFSQGKKLYEHIRRMHPEVNVDEVKKKEARRRGERRGRWTDERRQRSKSRGASRGPSQDRGLNRNDTDEEDTEDDKAESPHVNEDVESEDED